MDIGSGRIACVIAMRDIETGRISVLGGARVDCKGFKAGMVASIDEAAKGIVSVVHLAERRADQVVSEVLLGVRGQHIHSMDTRAMQHISRTDQEITAEDVVTVLENAKALALGRGKEILHVVPQKFVLDRLTGVPNPIGMQGELLEASAHVVLASAPAMSNLIKTVETAGFSLAAPPIYTPLAVGELVIAPEERAIGTLLADIGGQTTSLAIYADGALHFTCELPLGGDHISSDLAHGLGTTAAWARELKETYGATYTHLAAKDKKISVMKADRRTKVEINVRDMLNYIQPRVEEICDNANAAVQKSGYADLPGGVVIAGGGALLNGMPQAMAELLELPQSRLAAPVQELLDCPDEYLAQPYLGAVALVCYPYLKSWDETVDFSATGHPTIKDLWQWIMGWF